MVGCEKMPIGRYVDMDTWVTARRDGKDRQFHIETNQSIYSLIFFSISYTLSPLLSRGIFIYLGRWKVSKGVDIQ